MPIADDWARSARRRAVLYAIVTLAITVGAYLLCTRPTVRKLQARSWPAATATIDESTRVYDGDGKGDLVSGRRVRIAFAFDARDGTRRHAKQEVSAGFAATIGITEQGYSMFGRRPARIECRYDPADPDVAVLETSLGHVDVPVFFPLFTLLVGGILSAAKWRTQFGAEDAAQRAAARNDAGWNASVSDDGLTVSAKPSVEIGAMLVDGLLAMPVGSVSVAPHPVTPGAAVAVWLRPRVIRWWRRRLRVELCVGTFNTTGAMRHAAWSQTLFDGPVARDQTLKLSAQLPRTVDLPAAAVDCWLLVRWRTSAGLPWSRPVWLSIADR